MAPTTRGSALDGLSENVVRVRFVRDPTYGRQFHADGVTRFCPRSGERSRAAEGGQPYAWWATMRLGPPAPVKRPTSVEPAQMVIVIPPPPESGRVSHGALGGRRY